MNAISRLLIVLAALTPLALNGCAVGAGAAAAGGAYEYQNKRQLERLEEDFQAGNISREEYLKRKEMIEEGSVVY